MLTQLATVKDRLGILPGDLSSDALLTRMIEGVSARFDRECNRTFARTVGAKEEFLVGSLEIGVSCYPVETVSTWETKTTEGEGWVAQTGVDYLVRGGCVLSLSVPLLATPLGDLGRGGLCRVTYTGGYVLPGTTPTAGQTALPGDVEEAATEQVAVWWQQKDRLGLIRYWPSGGVYLVFAQNALLPNVGEVLRHYRRWSM